MNMKQEQEIFYHVSAKFKSSVCMQFLDAFVNKYNKILSLIKYSKQSYNRKIQGTEIDYQKDEETGTNITIRENNDYIGSINISINKYKNNVNIIDNMHTYFSNKKNSNTIVTQLNLSAGGISYIKISDYNNYGTKYQKLNKATRLVFDKLGELIDYEELHNESDSNKKKRAEIKK